MTSETTTLVSFSANPKGPRCPFGNAISFDLRPGGCVWLQGPSGRGKSTLASYLCNILPQSITILDKLQISASCQWNPSLQPSERCGVLFQQTTLLDELTVAGNLAVALDAVGCPLKDREMKIKHLLDVVGLSYHQDADKMPTELSGGMGRRASLALQLAQNKHVIFLDEPFAGLDFDVAASIAQELVHLRKTKGTAFILISHEPELAEKVMDASCEGNLICRLEEPKVVIPKQMQPHQHGTGNTYRGTTFLDRFWDKLVDYFIWSLPLILLAFLACGLAISMLTCETLKRLDVGDPVLKLVDKEIRPLIKMLTGQEATSLHMLGVRMKVSSLLNQTVPPAKANLYAIGMTKLFVLEIGPLLTALLLCGRIGGSYAGKLATMQATSQTKLLKTLGISPIAWSLYPAAFAVSIAGPLLTSIGTFLALVAASLVGSFYDIGDFDGFWDQARSNIFPTLRLSGQSCSSAYDTLIEIVTYPPIYHFVKAQVFIAIILGVAEISARTRLYVTPRKVPGIITQAVVTSGLFVILADWFFSQLWLKRK
jgi:ABC-type nitrate/sulfonate/bicarbonate transport system ATPase subunit/ABC-type transporter Mla maintaining outer membrane lipid asymmetry permease subunit MlaE